MIRALLAAALLAAPAALAQGLMQSAMPIWPTRDVTVTYKTIGPDSGRTMKIDHWSSGNIMRIDTADMAGGYVLIDRGKQRAMMVMTPMRMYVEARAGDTPMPYDLSDGKGTYTRAGTDTVAGIRCGIWNIAFQGYNEAACVTDDGVMLRYRDRRGGGVEATGMAYQPLSPASFTVPPDFQKIDANAMGGMMGAMPRGGGAIPGMPPGGIPGMPPGAMPGTNTPRQR